jgi:predicted DNA-binding transcriptional regulator AlpA
MPLKNNKKPNHEHLLSEQEVAQLLNVAIQTLRRWRKNGSGPIWTRIGRFAKYKPSDVHAFIESGKGGIATLLLGLIDWMELFGVG